MRLRGDNLRPFFLIMLLKPNAIYFDFFKRTKNERAIVLQGSRRSGKTVAIFQYLELCALFGGVKHILCINPSAPNLRDLMQVFTDVTGVQTHGSRKYGDCGVVGDCVFQFRAFDDFGKAQGSQGDIVFFNECNRLKYDMVTTALMGIRGKQIYDFNPANRFWIDRKINDNNFLQTTWRDNPYLPDWQVQEFLETEAAGNAPDASTLDRYMRDVYCLGIYGTTTGGLIFPNYKIISDSDYADILAMEILGTDWGATTARRDPDVVVGTKRLNGCLYITEYVYDNNLSDIEIACALDEQVKGTKEIAYETATDGKERHKKIKRMMRTPHNWRPCHKGAGSVLTGIKNVSQYKEIYITASSANIIREFDNYSWQEADGVLIPQDKFNHACDALRYAEDFFLRKYGRQLRKSIAQ